MTITTDQTRSVTVGNGTTTSFPTPFQFFDAVDIRVTLVVTAGGAETLQTLTTHYTVTGGNTGDGPAVGTVEMIISPTSLQKLVVELVDAFTQPEIYLRGGKFPARSIADGLDRANLHIQELRDIVGRAPRLPITDSPTTPSAPSIPDPVADEFLVGNAAGDGWEGKTAVDVGVITVPVTIANGGTNATSAANARTSLGLAIGSDVQAWDDNLDDLAGLAPTNSNFIVGDGTDWVAESGATARTSLGVAIGTDVQAHVITTQGDISRGDGSGDVERLALGAANTFLHSDASDAAWKALEGEALTLKTAVAAAAQTSIDFTSIPAWVKRITIQFVGISTSGTDDMWVQIGDAGGIEATGYLGGVARLADSGPVAIARSTTAFDIATSVIDGDIFHGDVVITRENTAAFTWVFSGVLMHSNDDVIQMIAGSKSLSETLTQVRITTTSGTDTFDAGEINILYE